jgi:hypothetical protein
MRVVGILIGLLVFSCNSVEKSEMKAMLQTHEDQPVFSQLVINEYSPKGTLISEYGEESDWIELYNASDSVLKIEKDEWFLSDDENKPEKFALPPLTLEPHGFILIFCDGKNSTEKNVHANFKISSDHETIFLYHNSELQDEIRCTENLKKKFSFGRDSDGQNFWSTLKVPSPGKTNDSSENYAETTH